MNFSTTARAVIGAAIVLGATASASAGITIVTRPINTPAEGDANYVDLFQTGAAGVYGVELRQPIRTSWEVGVGTRTSGNTFAQNEANLLTARTFTLVWTPTNLSFTVDGRTTTFAAPVAGDTLRAAAKRDATFTISAVDGVAFAETLSGTLGTGVSNELLFFSDDMFGGNGFTVTGTARIGTAGGTGQSASQIFFTLGDYTPAVAAIPEPGTWALMIAGFGMVGVASRRRRINVIAA